MLILAAGLLNLPLAALLVAAGIGVLRGLSWGRTLSLAYAWIMLAFASPLVVAQLVKNFQMFRHASTIYSVMGLSNVVIFVVADIIRTVVIFCGSVGYPIILLFLFCRPAWKRAFAPRANT